MSWCLFFFCFSRVSLCKPPNKPPYNSTRTQYYHDHNTNRDRTPQREHIVNVHIWDLICPYQNQNDPPSKKTTQREAPKCGAAPVAASSRAEVIICKGGVFLCSHEGCFFEVCGSVIDDFNMHALVHILDLPFVKKKEHGVVQADSSSNLKKLNERMR